MKKLKVNQQGLDILFTNKENKESSGITSSKRTQRKDIFIDNKF